MLADPKTAYAASRAERLPNDGDDILSILTPPANLYSAIGGGRSGATPMDDPGGQPRAFWREEIRAEGFARREKGQLAMFPVGDLNGIFINSSEKLRLALDLSLNRMDSSSARAVARRHGGHIRSRDRG